MPVTPPSTLLSGEQGVDVDDWFSSTGVRGRVPWGAGAWSIDWDTRAASGEALPPGLYFARFSFENATQAAKLVLLR